MYSPFNMLNEYELNPKKINLCNEMFMKTKTQKKSYLFYNGDIIVKWREQIHCYYGLNFQ